MRLSQVAALGLGLASSWSFAREAPDRGSPDRKRDQSKDDYYATSRTETATRGASVVVIVPPHAQTHPHDEGGVARASTGTPQPYFVSTTSMGGYGFCRTELYSCRISLILACPPTPKRTAGSPPPPPTPSVASTLQTISSPSGGLAEPSPIETLPATPYFPTGYPKGPLDSAQNQNV